MFGLEQVSSLPLAVVRRRAKQQELSKVVPDSLRCGVECYPFAAGFWGWAACCGLLG